MEGQNLRVGVLSLISRPKPEGALGYSEQPPIRQSRRQMLHSISDMAVPGPRPMGIVNQLSVFTSTAEKAYPTHKEIT